MRGQPSHRRRIREEWLGDALIVNTIRSIFGVAMCEWDDTKSAKNLIKHLISFDEAALIFEGEVLTRIDARFDYGEVRKVSIGTIRNVVVVSVVHTDRKGRIRIISARMANKAERTIYHEHLRKKT
jgi:uncharacterized protein